jgi:hypothetical protein
MLYSLAGCQLGSRNKAIDIKINFQPANTAVPNGYLPDSGDVYKDRGNGYSYGWSTLNSARVRERNSLPSPDKRYDTLNHMSSTDGRVPLTWDIALPAGTYSLHIVAGDPNFHDSVYRIAAEGELIVDGIPSESKRWIEATKDITVNDGKLTISNYHNAANNKICFLEIKSK